MFWRRLRTILRRTLYTFLVLGVLLFALWLLRAPLLEDRLRGELTQVLAEQLGGRWSVGSITGSWLGDLEVRDLRCEEEAADQSMVLGFDRLSADWDVLGFLGDRPAEAIQRLHLEGLTATIRPGPEPSPPGEPFQLEDLRPVLAHWPRSWPDLRIDGQVVLEGFLPDPITLEVALAPDSRRLKAEVEAAGLPAPWDPTRKVTATVFLEEQAGQLALDLDDGEEIAALKAGLREATDQLEVGLEGQLLAAALRASWSGNKVQLALDDLHTAQLPEPLAPWLDQAGLASVRVTRLQAEAALDPELAPTTASVSVQLDELRLKDRDGLAPGTLRARATYAASGEVTVPELELHVGGNRITGTGLEAHLEDLLAGPRAGRLEVALPDLEALAQTFLAPLPGSGDRPPLSLQLQATAQATGGARLEGRVSGGEGLALELTGLLHPAPTAGDAVRLSGHAALPFIETFLPAAERGHFAGHLRLEATVRDPLGALQAEVQVDGQELAAAARPIEVLRMAVRYAEDRAELTALRLEERGLSLQASGAFVVPEQRLDGLSFELTATDLARVPELAPGLPAMSGRLEGRGTASGRITDALDELRLDLDLQGEDLRVAEATLGRLQAKLHSDTRVLTVTALDLDGALGKVQARGTYTLAAATADLETLQLTLPDLSQLRSLLRDTVPALAGGLEVTASGRLTLPEDDARWPRGQASFAATGRGLRIAEEDVGALDAKASYEDGAVAVTSLGLDGSLARFAGQADLNLRTRRVELEGQLDVPDLARFASFLPEGPAPAGRLEAVVAATLSDWERPEGLEGNVRLTGHDLAYGAHALGTLNATVTGADQRVTLAPLVLDGPMARVRIAATLAREAGHEVVTLQSLEGSCHPGALPLELPLTLPETLVFALTEGPVVLRHGADGALDLDGLALFLTVPDVAQPVGHLRLGALRLEGEQLSLQEAQLRIEDLAQLSPDLRGRLALRAVVEPGDRLAAELRLSGASLTPERLTDFVGPEAPEALGQGLDLDLSLAQESEGPLVCRTLRMALGDPEAEATGGWVRAEGSGALPFRLEAFAPKEVAVTTGRFALDLNAPRALIASATRFAGLRELSAESLQIGARWNDDGLAADLTITDLAYWPDRPLEGGRAPQEVTDIFRLPGATRLRFGLETGALTLGLDTPENQPVTIAAQVRVQTPADGGLLPDFGQLNSAALEGEAALHLPDLTPFGALSPAIAQLAGALRTRNLKIEGTVGAPRLTGKLEGRELFAKMRTRTPTLDALDLDIAFEGARIVIERFAGRLGYGDLSLSGDVTLAEVPQFDLGVHGEEVLLLRTRDLRIRSDIDLAVKGPLDGLVVQGTTRLTEVLFTQYMDFLTATAPSADKDLVLFQVREGPLAATRLDIKVEAERSIEVRNNVARGRIGLEDFHLGGTLALPKPTGAASFSGLRVKLPFSRLTIDRGAIVFTEESPFRPTLEVAARTRVRGYEMDILARGDFGGPEIQFLSRPPLSRQDALLLLTTGATASGLASEGAQGAALSRAGSLLGATLFGESDDPDQKSLAERLDLQIGREISESGAYTLEVEYEYDDPWYLRAERDRFDAYNLGVVWRIRFR